MGNQNLFRSQKGLTVTSAGEQIIQFAKEVTTEQDRVRERIDELEGEIHGTPACSCVHYWSALAAKGAEAVC